MTELEIIDEMIKDDGNCITGPCRDCPLSGMCMYDQYIQAFNVTSTNWYTSEWRKWKLRVVKNWKAKHDKTNG